jgi:drug/metabolite transporter (DMT)-like permease
MERSGFGAQTLSVTRRTLVLTLAALVAFASNSLLCRAALRGGAIDAATFTSVRMAAGALALALLVRVRASSWSAIRGGSALAAVALYGYAIAFSFAYLRLEAGAGALILFGSVQVTMIGWSVARGQAPHALFWVGLAVALFGLVLLTAPGRAAPDLTGALLMALAGAAWGVYSLLGRSSPQPVAANAANFLRTLPLALAASLLLRPGFRASAAGLALAVVSGALTSGVGYAIWYAALPGLSSSRAAVVQLAVPVLAAVGAVALLGERVTTRLLASGLLVLGGIGLALYEKARETAPQPPR